jgi:hypothetical protein
MPRRWPLRSFSLATVFWFVTVLMLLLALLTETLQRNNAVRRMSQLEQEVYDALNVPIEYGRITFFKIDGDIYALRLTPDASNSWRVEFEWMRFRAGDDLNVTWRELFDGKMEDDRGSGSANEQVGDIGIPIGPVVINWSTGDATFCWFYLSQAHGKALSGSPQFEMSREQYDDLTHAKSLPDKGWRRIELRW